MEDASFRDSTQFRHWSFSAAEYNNLRTTAHSTALTRLPSTAPVHPSQTDSDTLLLASLLELYHLSTTTFKFPSNVTYTAIIFLSRFFTLHSPLTYDPQSLIPTTLYLTSKTENHYVSMGSFLRGLPERYNASKESLLAPEFVVSSGIRWSFDVRQPFRALEAVVLEILALIEGSYLAPASHDVAGALARFKEKAGEVNAEDVKVLHGNARGLLKLEVPTCEVPFLYTPGQIALAALIAGGGNGHALVEGYLAAKGADKVTHLIQDCARRIHAQHERLKTCKGDAWDAEVARVKSLIESCRGKGVDFIKSDEIVKSSGGMDKVKKANGGPRMRDEDVFGEGFGDIPKRN